MDMSLRKRWKQIPRVIQDEINFAKAIEEKYI
jgi:hypothetical protein